MRRAQLHEFVVGLVASTWEGGDVDVATPVLADALGVLVHRLQQVGAPQWTAVVTQLGRQQSSASWSREPTARTRFSLTGVYN